MSKQQFAEEINKVINQGVTFGLKAYAYIEEDDNVKIQNINILDALNDKVKNLVVDVIKTQYLDENVEFDDISNVADNKKIIYELIQDDEYRPFEFLQNINSITEEFRNNDKDKLKGFIFKLNLDDNNIFVYQQAYSGTKIKNKNVLHIIKSGTDKYDVFDKELLRIDKRAEIILLNDTLYVKNIGVLQDKFKFDRYVRAEAKNVIEKIKNLDIVTNIQKIEECESEQKLTSAKKIMKLKNSPVLKMDRHTLIQRLKTIDKYKNSLKIENEKIITKTKKDVQNLVKMLNDDVLKSELTNKEYESSIKKVI